MKIKNKTGFTLIEILLVIVLLTILVGLAALYYQNSQVSSDINAQVSNFISETRLLQSNAASGLYNSSYGVHLEENSFTIFKGDQYNPEDAENFVFTLPSTIKIQNINLNGGGADIIFDRPSGTTDNFGTFEFSSQLINKKIIININKIGNVEQI